MKGLKDRVAVVTGAASGIGKATACRFAQEGVRLLIADIAEEAGQGLAEELSGNGAACVFHPCDVSQLNQVEGMIEAAVQCYGGIDILVNNAGVGTYGKTPDLDPEEWHKVIRVNLDSVFYGCRSVIPPMREGGGGVIVNTASISGLFADFGLTAYNAAKAAVINYTRSVALDHGPEGIRANAVCPGAVDTGLTNAVFNHPGVREKFNNVIPLRRIGEPPEIAGAIAFLCSDDASYITGASLVIDGGLTLDTGQPSYSAFLGDE